MFAGNVIVSIIGSVSVSVSVSVRVSVIALLPFDSIVLVIVYCYRCPFHFRLRKH